MKALASSFGLAVSAQAGVAPVIPAQAGIRHPVVPAKAGTQEIVACQHLLDSRLRGNDGRDSRLRGDDGRADRRLRAHDGVVR